jgi:hypothetical protein
LQTPQLRDASGGVAKSMTGRRVKGYGSGMKKKLIILAGSLVLFGALFVLGFRYYNLINFKDSLADLVESKTNGQYKLVIGDAKMNLRELQFELKNVSLIKTGKADPSGIESVMIPSMEAEAGSLRSLLNSGQMVIERLTIQEPVLKMAAKANNVQPEVNIAHSLVKIFPAIEAVLDKFLIKSFTLRRGALQIKKEGENLISLRLIDFIIRDWNMRELTDSSKVRLNLQGQRLLLSKTSISFSEIAFQYPEHFLEFKDLALESEDTTSRSHIKVEGKSVLIQGLDYNELYNHQRYKLKKIHIEKPVISGTLRVGGAHSQVKHPVKAMLQQVFGEALLDSAIINDADIALTVYHGQDSIHTRLPHVDVNISNFEVRADTSALLVDGVRIDLNETSVRLNNNVTLHCDDLTFLRGGYLTITNASFIDVAAKKSFIQCQRIALDQFGLIDFVFYRKLYLKSALIENADVNITPHYLDLFPKMSSDVKDTTHVEQRLDKYVGGLRLRNANIRFNDGTRSMTIQRANLDVKSFGTASVKTLLSRLSLFSAAGVTFDSPKDSTHIKAVEVSLSKNQFAVGRVELRLKRLMASGRSISIQDYVLAEDTLGNAVMEKIEIASLSLKGVLPAGKDQPTSKKSTVALLMKDFQIGKLETDVRWKDKHVAFNASALTGRSIRVRDGNVNYEHLVGNIDHFRFQQPETDVSIESLDLNFFKETQLKNARVHLRNNDIRVPSATIGKVDFEDKATQVSYLHAAHIDLQQNGVLLFATDSLAAKGIVLRPGKDPRIKSLAAYRPIIHLPKPAATTSKKEKSSKGIPTDVVEAFALYDGELTLPKGQVLKFTKAEGDLNAAHQVLSLDEATFGTDKIALQLNGLKVQEGRLDIKRFTITPQEAFAKNLAVETSLVTGELTDISLLDFHLDSLVAHQTLVASSVNVDKFSLHISKDKRLPDAVPKEKPFLLQEMLVPMIHAKKLKVRDGFIRYRETSDITGKEGEISLHKITIEASSVDAHKYLSDGLTVNATTRLYDQGEVHLNYRFLSPEQFALTIDMLPFDLTMLNTLIVPLKAMEIKSGDLEALHVNVTAGRERAVGSATMSYQNLHLELFSRTDPEKKNLGSTLLTLLADDLVLKHNKQHATATIDQTRIPTKSVFNYWIRIAAQGALNVVRHGKPAKKIKAV